MATFNAEIVKFANGNEDTIKYFEKAQDYIIHRFSNDGRKLGNYEDGSLSMKSTKLNDAFFAEVSRRAGVARTEENAEAWAMHPSVKWAFMAIVDATINTLLPITTFPNMADFVDFRVARYGDVVKFRVMPRELFIVSRGN